MTRHSVFGYYLHASPPGRRLYSCPVIATRALVRIRIHVVSVSIGAMTRSELYWRGQNPKPPCENRTRVRFCLLRRVSMRVSVDLILQNRRANRRCQPNNQPNNHQIGWLVVWLVKTANQIKQSAPQKPNFSLGGGVHCYSLPACMSCLLLSQIHNSVSTDVL